jgi:outer membrane protein OmpA-like peptidoglycan-associated protein
MNYKPFFILLFFLKSFTAAAMGNDTLKIFYDINKYELSAADKLKIETMADSLHVTDTIRVFGYADYLGNSKDNIILSVRRAEAIKNYLLSLNKSLVVLTDGKGEVEATAPRSSAGEPVNRRVDIIKPDKPQPKKLIAELPKNKPVERKIKTPEVKPDSTHRITPEILPTEPVSKNGGSFRERLNDLGKLDIGSSISFEELTFQPGRHFLNPEAVAYVNTLLKYLKKHNNIVFEIIGHICCDDDHKDGIDFDTGEYTLSTNRAKFIYDYFLSKGISADRMTYKGTGGSKPKIYPERTEHDRYLNRRVELLIVGK